MPENLPEYYSSHTCFVNTVRNGVTTYLHHGSVRALYLRNKR